MNAKARRSRGIVREAKNIENGTRRELIQRGRREEGILVQWNLDQASVPPAEGVELQAALAARRCRQRLVLA